MKTESLIGFIKNSKKTLFILSGLPYSGKTSFIKTVNTGSLIGIVAIDTLLTVAGYDWNTNALPDSKGWENIMQRSYDQTKEFLNQNKSVLYDSTNHTRSSRDTLREIARECGAKTYVIFFDVSEAEIRERWQNNKENQKRFVLSEGLFDQTINALEKPTDDENVIIFEE